MAIDPSARLLHDLRRANDEPAPELEARPERTFGDALDIAFGGPEHYVCSHCRHDRDEPPSHRMCLGRSGGRTCECAEGPHPLRRRR